MDTPALRLELVELQSSLTSIKQQLERAFRVLDRIGAKVESRKKFRKGIPSSISSSSASVGVPQLPPIASQSSTTAHYPPSATPRRGEDGGGPLSTQHQHEEEGEEEEGEEEEEDDRITRGSSGKRSAPKDSSAATLETPPPVRKKRKASPTPDIPIHLTRQDLIGTLAPLPEEILIQIFNFLDITALSSLSLVCSTIKAIAEGYPWRKIYIQRFQLLEDMLPQDLDSPRRWKFKVAEGRALLRTWQQPPRERIALRGHNRPVTYLQMRGNKLMSCDDSVMRQWDLASGKAIVSFATDAKNKCYHFQFDDERLVVSNVDAVRVYDEETSEFLYLLEGVESYANRLKLTTQFIVGGMWDGYIRTWRIADKGPLTAKFFGHLLPVYCLDAVPDKIVSGSSDKWLKIYDAQLQTTLATLKGHNMTVTAVQLNELMGCMYSGSRDKCIIRWDMRARNVPIHRWMGHEDMITSLQFDGFKLVTGGMDAIVKVWDVRTSKILYTITGNEGGVRCLQFSGSDLVVGGSDGVVSILRYCL